MGSGLVGLDGCEVRLCDPCARLCPCVLCVPCVSRLPPVSFYRYYATIRVPVCARVSVSRVCPGSPRCLFTGTVLYVLYPRYTSRLAVSAVQYQG